MQQTTEIATGRKGASNCLVARRNDGLVSVAFRNWSTSGDKTMKKAMLVTFVAMMMVSFSGVAMALTPSDPPTWWDDPQFQTQTTTITINTEGTGVASGKVTRIALLYSGSRNRGNS